MFGKGTRLFRYKMNNGVRAFQKWIIPYVRSRFHDSRLSPLVAYLYTDWKCNIDCHYCFQYNNSQPGMTMETAVESMDWLHAPGCRVIALMGGEPLVRGDVISYAS